MFLFVYDTEKQNGMYQKKKTVVGSQARDINKYKYLKHKALKCNGTITIFRSALPSFKSLISFFPTIP